MRRTPMPKSRDAAGVSVCRARSSAAPQARDEDRRDLAEAAAPGERRRAARVVRRARRGPRAPRTSALCLLEAGILPATQARVSVAIQLTSQVFPPSAENDCSKRQEVRVTSEMTKRTRIARPLYIS